MAADVIDLDSAQTGKRQGGAYFSIWSMTRKLAYALGLFGGTSLVVFWGFDSLADPMNTTNTQFSLLMLAITYSVIPALFKFVAMPLLWNYPLTEKKLAESLMTSYKRLRNYKKAIEFAEIYITTADSLYNKEKTKEKRINTKSKFLAHKP